MVRPDVGGAFPDVDHARFAGFQGALVLEAGTFDLALEALLADGTTQPIASIKGQVTNARR
jgi:hypothetical protein